MMNRIRKYLLLFLQELDKIIPDNPAFRLPGCSDKKED